MEMTPFEKGRAYIAQSLDQWQEFGKLSRQAYTQYQRKDKQEELDHARSMAVRPENDETQQEHWNRQVEYFSGMLARLAEEL